MKTNYGKSFFDFCTKRNIGKWYLNPFDSRLYFEMSRKDFAKLKRLNVIYDGTKGGLVLGNLHSQGGISFIMRNPLRNNYVWTGEMEGWEYLSAPLGNNLLVRSKMENINDNEKDKVKEGAFKTDFEIPKDCKIIDTRASKVPLLIITPEHAIINRLSTKKYIKELIKLDKLLTK